MTVRLFVFLFVVLIAGAVPAGAQRSGFDSPSGSERILSYNSDVTIQKDATVRFVETVTVRANGQQIRRGILREYPTKYPDQNGDTIEIGLNVISVTRDGKPEPFAVEPYGNGVQMRIGSENVFLQPGTYTYVITYDVTFLIGYFDEGDEFYYNIIGHGTEYWTDEATATIRLPPGVTATDLVVWTGPQGTFAKDATIAQVEPGVVKVRANNPLPPRNGMTVGVRWPKGLIDQPSGGDYLWRWLSSNLSALFGLGGLGAAFAFLYWGWRRWGKDPERGTIIPLFEPPGGMEPAETRFLAEMGYDNKIFAAAVVSMATKGAVKIDEDPNGWFSKDYTLSRTGEGAEKLSPIERRAYDQLFLTDDSIVLAQKNWQRLKAAKDAIEGSLKLTHVGKSFTENTGVIAGAFGLLVLGALAVWATANNGLAPWIGGAALVIGVIIVGLFIQLMKAPTRSGQDLRDKIDGFKMYLDTAEKERWEVLNPPEMTPQLFEKYLPFALALGVDHTWSETFEREMRIREPGEYHYQPRWYSGRNFSGIGAGALTSSISSSMANAISSSSSPPGKSSAFGGRGGFSGGGGGGGGIKGW